MKGSMGFGSPKQQRLYMQYGYATRPSFWQEVKANAHLIIAAVGTAALLSIAGVGLWLAMPRADREAFAAAGQASLNSQPVSSASASPQTAQGQTGTNVAEVATAAQAPSGGLPPPRVVKTHTIVVGANQPGNTSDLSGGNPAMAALPVTDPRWSAEGARVAAPGQNPIAAKSGPQGADKPAGTDVASAAPSGEAAFAAAEPAPASIPIPQDAPRADDPAQKPVQDSALTAAIPDVKPDSPEPPKANGNGHILRAVTMRSGPKKGASQITTIPARAAVEVIACKQWCQVLYKGKTGWIYKSFLKRD